MANDRDKNMVDDWPQAGQYRRSIRIEFSLYVSLAILVMMLTTGLVITNKYVDTVTRGVVETLLVQARAYSGPAGKHILATDRPDALLLNNVCNNLASDDPEVYWVGIADRTGAYLAHTDIRTLVGGGRLAPLVGSEQLDKLRPGERIEIRGDTIFTDVPIAENQIELGRLRIASSAAPISTARTESIVTVAGITLVMLVLGLPIAMFLVSRKLRPVRTITDSLKTVNLEDIQITIPFRSRNEFGYLAETIEVMGAKLGAAQQHLLEKDRIERELAIARDIQANILPRSYPRSDSYDLAGVSHPARDVGGDYFDFIPIDQHLMGVLVADVSGKSLPGMLVMLLTRDIVRQARHLMHRPEQLLSHVNRELSSNIRKGMFVTMLYGVLDSQRGIMRFASAGHNPLIHMDRSGRDVELLKTKGYPLGMMPPKPFEERLEAGEVSLAKDDWLILYTDGINEAMDPSGREFGMDRFLDTIRASSHRPPAELVESSLMDHRQFVNGAEQSDDITLVAMRWLGTGTGGVPKEEGKTAYASR